MSKVRVHELAKGLNLQSKELINIITGLGVDVKSHMSILEGKDLEIVIGHFRKLESEKSKKEEKKEVKTEDKKNSFDEILSLTLDKITSEAKVSDKLEQFKKRLTEIGAAGFINELNSNKIEEKIAQKKEELTELLSINDPTKTQDQKNELLKIMDKILRANRSQFDVELIDKDGGAKDILKALKARRIVGILVDQNTAPKDGIKVQFFGKDVLHTPAASVLAQKTDALIVSAFIYQKDENLNEICFEQPIDISTFDKEDAVQKATQMQCSACEEMVRARPEEYFWFHQRFKRFYENEYKC